MDANMIANLQERTSAKLRYAAVHLAEIVELPGLTGDDFERAHQESFLFHLMGAVDAFLAEINCYYGCNLPDEGISPGKLREAIIKMRGETSAELKELYRLEKLAGSWLEHAKTMRHHSTHVGGVPRVFNLGGVKNDGEVWLKNPVSGEVIEEDYPVVFKKWHEETSGIIARLRAQALTGMTASVDG